MTDMKRRRVLAGAAAGAAAIGATVVAKAAEFGNPDRPAQGAINSSAIANAEPGPQNPQLRDVLPSFNNPPPTDVGGMPIPWASFNLAHKRIQDGGWAREVTTKAFPISKDIAGVNMRLGPGGVRELHWHQQAEWAMMVSGEVRITTIDSKGRAEVADVQAGDLWYFPPGLPHSLQGLGANGGEFVLAFDNGAAGEFNTLMVSDWLAHTPPDILAQNFGVPADKFKNIPLDQLWIYQGANAGPLAAQQAYVASKDGRPDHPFIFRMGSMTPTLAQPGGEVRIVDSSNFPISKTVAAAMVTLRPGGLREMHWHPDADEWQYFIQGTGRMTVFNSGPAAQTVDFSPGDVGYVEKNLGHYVKNTGTTDLVFLELFKSDHFSEVTLSQWLANTPRQLVREHLRVDDATLDVIHKLKNRRDVIA
ncbi:MULTISPECIES: cupin domain-containing protein [unclassified Janthinobacterium]|uniref:cupin domain-containing protein n=1 Tax=unclassified Janthinobacterium TaxID=2610881 RepID=UPI00161C92D6|nr:MULTISPECIES: cupin domain-containing protein [unclassified Janthinobacterium]MBB5370643.1 oxalate decarboxylase [Janthinobacterium sp. K2C7]MBB5383449.1 oxalate decarboxylase [Janthinobacterium sp. K2Li3]MBB5388903.1 oxalate decarboxylase [Janthinobacterium sp. K2E3]